jgi:hypothetical protein
VRGPVGNEAAIVSADWIALMLVSREPGSRRYINIACFWCTGRVVCYALWEVPTHVIDEIN